MIEETADGDFLLLLERHHGEGDDPRREEGDDHRMQGNHQIVGANEGVQNPIDHRGHETWHSNRKVAHLMRRNN